MRVPGIRVFLPVVFSLVPSFLAAQEIPNWTVPPYRGSDSAQGGLTTMADVTPGIAFVGIQPCRVADTRGNGAPIQGGIFANSALRTWDLTGICGIPAGTDAISANFTVVAAGGIPAGSFLLAWPTGQAAPPTAIMTYGPGQIISNAAIVPLGPGEQLNVNVSGSTHIVMDVNGYFTDAYNPGVSFHAVSGTSAPAILGENTSATPYAIGVFGQATATGAIETAGVWGRTNSPGGAAGAWGVLGLAANTTGRTYGVWGETKSVVVGAAGVFGLDGDGLTAGHSTYEQAGVRGESRFGTGVLGMTDNNEGVIGIHVNPANGNPIAAGILGFGTYGVYSAGDAHVQGTFTATTNKGFVQPHPFDASKEIRYISLEGPHTEVYFRGTAQVSQGVTRIAVPQDFRFVADAATYSTLVTPVGEMATVAVLAEGPEGIVVRASRDVKVHYVVYAEREAVRNPDPIIENVHFVPEPDRDVLANLPSSFRQLMIQNGTLNPDGTVNMETARRLGWDKEWEKRSQPSAQRSGD